jgi:hypothetical protein
LEGRASGRRSVAGLRLAGRENDARQNDREPSATHEKTIPAAANGGKSASFSIAQRRSRNGVDFAARVLQPFARLGWGNRKGEVDHADMG